MTNGTVCKDLYTIAGTEIEFENEINELEKMGFKLSGFSGSDRTNKKNTLSLMIIRWNNDRNNIINGRSIPSAARILAGDEQ